MARILHVYEQSGRTHTIVQTGELVAEIVTEPRYDDHGVKHGYTYFVRSSADVHPSPSTAINAGMQDVQRLARVVEVIPEWRLTDDGV